MKVRTLVMGVCAAAAFDDVTLDIYRDWDSVFRPQPSCGKLERVLGHAVGVA